MFYKTENFFLKKTAVLSLFQLRLVKHIFSKHRVQSKLSYFIMIFNYQHKKKEIKKNPKFRLLNFIERWGGGSLS